MSNIEVLTDDDLDPLARMQALHAREIAALERIAAALERIAPAAPLVSDGKEFPGTPTILEGYLARIVMALEHGNEVAHHTVK